VTRPDQRFSQISSTPYSRTSNKALTPFLSFTREDWRELRASTPLSLSEEDLTELKGLNDRISLREVTDIYLPLSRLLNLYVAATQNLYTASSAFLGTQVAKVPYIIGIGGSVAVGKSTTARIIQRLLSSWPNHPKVDLVTTDGFLYPNEVLQSRNLLSRKGFPESYDVRALMQFMSDVKSGRPEVKAPVYSHLVYDIVPRESIVIHHPDIMIVEGLNVLQVNSRRKSADLQLFVSDFFDFSIYVDAEESLIREWYIERFQTLRNTAFVNPESYFHRYAELGDEEAVAMATQIWASINGPNLHENIKPTRARAHLILEKGHHHNIDNVYLRRL
jgi:type I pantothenate kinase